MTPADLELAREAVGLPTWRWLPGMLTLPDGHGRVWRVVSVDTGTSAVRPPLALASGPVLRCVAPPLAAMLPDLSDDCTRGGVLRLVEDAYPDGWVWVAPSPLGSGYPWAVWWWTGGTDAPRVVGLGDGRSAALVAALRSAPVRDGGTLPDGGAS